MLVDAIKFVKFNIAKKERETEELTIKYTAAKMVYEESFFPKLFGWKYENSRAGDLSWVANFRRYNDWDFDVCSPKRYKSLLRKFTYHKKIGDELIEMDSDLMGKFYLFCYNNNLPYKD